MTVTFRPLKLKHYRKAQEINARVDAGEADDVEVVEFAASLVARWDFVDVDTGDRLRLSDVEELSTDQMTELLNSFSEEFVGATGAVPKTNGSPSPSTSTPESPVENLESPPTGYTPLYSPAELA